MVVISPTANVDGKFLPLDGAQTPTHHINQRVEKLNALMLFNM